MIDVRQRNEYEAGHIPGADQRRARRARRPACLPDGPVTVMCGHGERAMTGASILDRPRPPRRRGARRRPRHLGRVRPASHWRSADEHDHDATDAASASGCARTSAQFSLLVGVNALVGGMIGQERTVLPLLADEEFGLTAFTATLTFIVAFGIVKAATNFFAGTLSDRYGRKPVLVAGWLIGLPVPLLLMWAPTWGWVVFANVLLGVNQGLTWSTTVIMKIDLVGPARRGLAMGLNEAAGYGAVAAHRARHRLHRRAARAAPAPFFLGLAYAGLGLGLSTLFVRETHGHARHEAANHVATDDDLHDELTTGEIFTLTSLPRDRRCRRARQAGLVNNLNDGLAWGLFPIFFADAGLSVGRIGVLAAIYPAVWGLGQLVTGAPLGPDRPQAAHRRRHAHPGRRHRLDRRHHRLRRLGARRRPARRRHRDGVPDPARRDRRRRPPRLAGPLGRRLPALARRRLRRRRPPRRHPRRPRLASTPRSGPSPPSPPPPGSSSSSACTKPTAQPRDIPPGTASVGGCSPRATRRRWLHAADRTIGGRLQRSPSSSGRSRR